MRARSLAGRVLIAALALPAAGAAQPTTPFDPGHAPFALRFGDEEVRYRELARFVLPGETRRIEVDGGGGALTLRADGGTLEREGRQAAWRFTAPERPGLVRIVLRDRHTDVSLRLHVFVMHPRRAVKGGRLNGYRIGSYPGKPLRGLPSYAAPRGFVEVTPENFETPVSPHFRLGQFVCKQEGGPPRYLVLNERLLLKLEGLLQIVNERGIRADRFAVLSGYRTPAYNRGLGNVQHSRHLYGDAADIFVDESPRDGWMDDLDGDGDADRGDADLLYRLFDPLHGRETWQRLVGGLGLYGPTAAHGAFVHVDTRGQPARWGR